MWRVALVVIVACAAPQRHFAPPDRTAITAVLDAQVAAWNRGDLDAYMAGYARSEDLVFTSGGNVRRGWQTAFDHYKDKYAKDPAAMGHLVFEILSIQPVGADAAVVLGKWTLTQSPSDGHGVFSVVLERLPEGWRIVHDHTSISA
jgi:uncharacterized protein (TIGR02246 family)